MIIDNKRANPDKTTELENEIINYRNAIREAQEVISLKDHPGWLQLQRNVKAQLDSVEEELDNFEKLDEKKTIIKLKERKDFRWMINVVDKVDEKLPTLLTAIKAIENELDKRKSRETAR